ncbi:hypothetical protein BHM03_00014913 [Ensete ventricosum]|nr:hypothetical protein BHM03_00014913 [Ensete ventricosum]
MISGKRETTKRIQLKVYEQLITMNQGIYPKKKRSCPPPPPFPPAVAGVLVLVAHGRSFLGGKQGSARRRRRKLSTGLWQYNIIGFIASKNDMTKMSSTLLHFGGPTRELSSPSSPPIGVLVTELPIPLRRLPHHLRYPLQEPPSPPPPPHSLFSADTGRLHTLPVAPDRLLSTVRPRQVRKNLVLSYLIYLPPLHLLNLEHHQNYVVLANDK